MSKQRFVAGGFGGALQRRPLIAAAMLLFSLLMLSSQVGDGLAAVPTQAVGVWTDTSGDATGDTLPPLNGATQPGKDLIAGYVCNDSNYVRFYLQMADLGIGPQSAANGVPQVEWAVRLGLKDGLTYFASATVTGGTTVTYQDGFINAGAESPYASPTLKGSFGAGARGLVELDFPMDNFGIARGDSITGIRALTTDHSPGLGTNPVAMVVDEAGSGAYTVGTWTCGSAPSAVPAPGAARYVATTGSDASTGSVASPFRTIQHCADASAAGDTCLIMGGMYRESVHPPGSVTFAAYNGQAVTVSGADTVSGWSQVRSSDIGLQDSLVPGYVNSVASGHVYRTNTEMNPSLFANQLFADGKMLSEARYPAAGPNPLTWAPKLAGIATTPSSIANEDQVSATAFPPGYWVGGTVHVCGTDCWLLWDGTITGSVQGQITFTSQYNSPGYASDCAYLCAKWMSPYYLSGKLGALDSPGQWFYDQPSKGLYVYLPDGGDPSAHLVETKQRNYAFDLSGVSHVSIVGLSIFGSSILTDDLSADNVIDGIHATYVSHFTTLPAPEVVASLYESAAHLRDSGIILKGTRNVLKNSVVAYSAGPLASVQGDGNTVTNNVLSEGNYGGTFGGAVHIEGSDQGVTHNTIYDTGMDGITLFNFDDPPVTLGGNTYPQFYNNRISYNEIFNTHVRQQDGGGIYVCCARSLGLTIDHNLIHDDMAKNGRGTDGYGGPGIYLDLDADHADIHHNVVWNVGNAALELNGHSSYLYQRSDRVYNNTFGGGQAASLATYLVNDFNNTEFTNNIFRGSVDSKPGATWTTNLTSDTDPKFTNEAKFDFHLQTGSPAIDAGTVLPGFTDGYVGSAPDIGAYESASPDWSAGCSMTACKLTTVDDPSAAWTYTGSGWAHCTGGCNATTFTTLPYPYGGSTTTSSMAGDVASSTFSGSGAILHLEKGAYNGFAGISLDGGPETVVDTYINNKAGDQVVWATQGLASGTHTLSVRVIGAQQQYSAGSDISIDRLDVIP